MMIWFTSFYCQPITGNYEGNKLVYLFLTGKLYLFLEDKGSRRSNLYMKHMFYLSDLAREGRFLVVEESIFSGFLFLVI